VIVVEVVVGVVVIVVEVVFEVVVIVVEVVFEVVAIVVEVEVEGVEGFSDPQEYPVPHALLTLRGHVSGHVVPKI